MAQPSIALSEITLLSLAGWHHFGQTLLNDTYLQPYENARLWPNAAPARKKLNPQNGYIEREVHGAMHATRVSCSTIMMHQLCQQQYPDEVNTKIRALMQFSHLNEEELFYLIRFLGLGHATFRLNARQLDNANYMEFFLKRQGLDEQLAAIASSLISLKKSHELIAYLAPYHLATEVIEGLQYARLLINLANSFDGLRYSGSFRFNAIEQQLATVFSSKNEKDALVFFNYAQHTLQLLKRQKDLCFPYIALIGFQQEDLSLEEGEEYFSVREKVKLEHASNVLAAMIGSFNQDSYFKTLLNIETPVQPSLYEKALPFNPFIHGTNSTALALMTQTNFQMLSTIQMLEQHGIAPLAGEITQGGLDYTMNTGDSCFAKLSGDEDTHEYTLKKIIKNYATVSMQEPKKECLKNLRHYCSNHSQYLFSTINVINVFLARARQLGIDLQKIPEVRSLEKEFYASRDILYLYLLFSTHIVAKKEAGELLSVEELKKHFPLNRVSQVLREANISVKEIYHHPTPENCQKIIDIFTLQKQSNVYQLFEYLSTPLIDKRDYEKVKIDLFYLARNDEQDSFINIIKKTYQKTYNREDFKQIAPKLLSYIKILESRFLVTQNLLRNPQKPLLVSPEDSDLIKNPLPIILCYEHSRYIRIFGYREQEYRTQHALQLGEHIQIIATDTETNIRRLQAYSDRHQLNLTVISFADLQRARDSLKTETPLISHDIRNRVSNKDIISLHDFCIQQQARLKNSSEFKSLGRFQIKAESIILSNLPAAEKRTQLKACAHQEFAHRHFLPRLLADTLLLISSFALVGLAVGLTRTLTGHRFFFSAEKTRRETNFTEVADKMELSCGA